jgi:hypothetical protein
LTLKTENALFLMARHYFYLQDIKISFGHVDCYANMLLVLGARVRNSPTQQTIVDKKYEVFVISTGSLRKGLKKEEKLALSSC